MQKLISWQAGIAMAAALAAVALVLVFSGAANRSADSVTIVFYHSNGEVVGVSIRDRCSHIKLRDDGVFFNGVEMLPPETSKTE